MTKKTEPKSLKEILSTDYHIPGISPRFYLPVFIFSIAVAFYLTPNFATTDAVFFGAFLVLVAISTVSAFVGKVIRRLRRH